MSDVEHAEEETEKIGVININNNPNNTNNSVNSKKCIKFLGQLIFSTPGLVALVMIYSIMGAMIFPLLEEPNHLQTSVVVSHSREECLKELWTITERLNVLYEKNWTLLVHEQLRRFEGSIVAATKGGLNVESVLDNDQQLLPKWTFSEALLYSVTVITTIGHGNLSPKTSGGKIATMIYALVGVPLMLMCLSSLGGFFADALQCGYIKLCGTRNKNNHHYNHNHQNQQYYYQYQQRNQTQQHQHQQHRFINQNQQNHHQHHHHQHHHHQAEHNNQQIQLNQHHHQRTTNCIQELQNDEMDCNICKFDAVCKDTKLEMYDKYMDVNDREVESCQLIRNSPLKSMKMMSLMPMHSLPCSQTTTIKHINSNNSKLQYNMTTILSRGLSPLTIPTTSSSSPSSSSSTTATLPNSILTSASANNKHNIDNGIHRHHQQQQQHQQNVESVDNIFPINRIQQQQQQQQQQHQQKQQQHQNQCLSSQTFQQQINSNNNHGFELQNHLAPNNSTILPPAIAASGCNDSGGGGGGGGGCSINGEGGIAISTERNNVISQQHHQHQNQQHDMQHYHLATIHGLGRSKFLPKPLPPEINLLLTDCGALTNYHHQQNQHEPPGDVSTALHNYSGCGGSVGSGGGVVGVMVNMDSLEDDDDEDSRFGCPHGTPSRIPLIKQQKPLVIVNKQQQQQQQQYNDYSNNSNLNGRRHSNIGVNDIGNNSIVVNSNNSICNTTIISSNKKDTKRDNNHHRPSKYKHQQNMHKITGGNDDDHNDYDDNNDEDCGVIIDNDNNSRGNGIDDNGDGGNGDGDCDNGEGDIDDDNNIYNCNINPQVPIIIIFIILVTYICIGTVIFSLLENWSIVDGAYFCFVTLSTIGFGDLVPNKSFRGPELQLIACCLYLLLGLVLMAMAFSVLETQLLWKCRLMAVRLKLVAKD